MEVMAMLEKEVHYCKHIMLSECCWSPTGRLLYRGKFYVPTYCDTGVYRNRSARRIKGNQATFDNSQRNNLRSCVWLSVVVFGEEVRAGFSSVEAENLRLFI